MFCWSQFHVMLVLFPSPLVLQVFMFLFDRMGKLLHANQRAMDHYVAPQPSGISL